jgi:hypothetical protein
MGSFRSQPDLQKHTQVQVKTGQAFTYAVTHMCGTSNTIQVGEFTWKTLILLKPSLLNAKTPSSESSMGTGVYLP